MLRSVRWIAVAGAVAGIGGAADTQAAPISYAFASGTLTLSASVGGQLVGAPVTVALDGQQVTVDEAALSLDSLAFTISGATLTLTTPYGGYDTIHLDAMSITASGGTLSFVPPADNPQEYGFQVGPVQVSGQYDATGSGPPITDAAFVFQTPSASGTLFVGSGPGGGTLSLDGITVGAFWTSGEQQPLVLKADITFQGASSVVPEPGAVALFGTGLGVVSLMLRRRIS